MGQEVDIQEPPETAMFKAMGVHVEQMGEDDWAIRFLIHPLKMVVVRVSDEGKKTLLSQLAGGIAVATSMPT